MIPASDRPLRRMARSWIRCIHQNAHVQPMGTRHTHGATRVDDRSSCPFKVLRTSAPADKERIVNKSLKSHGQAEVAEGVAQVHAVDAQEVRLLAREQRQGLARAQPSEARKCVLLMRPSRMSLSRSPFLLCLLLSFFFFLLLHEETAHVLTRRSADGVLDDASRLQVTHEASVLRHVLQRRSSETFANPTPSCASPLCRARGRNGR